MSELQEFRERAAKRDVMDSRSGVCARGNHSTAVWTKAGIENHVEMAAQSRYGPAIVDSPDTGRVVLASRHDEPAVRTEANTFDAVSVSPKFAQKAPRCCIPDPADGIRLASACRDLSSVGIECERMDIGLFSLEPGP